MSEKNKNNEIQKLSKDLGFKELARKLHEKNISNVIYTTVLERISFSSVFIVFPFYMVTVLKLDAWEIGLIMSSYFLGEMFAISIIGYLSDKIFERRIFMVLGHLVASLFYLSIYLSSDVLVLTITHAIQGVGAATRNAPALAILGHGTKYDERGKIMGKYEVAYNGGTLIGYISGPFVYEIFNRTPFGGVMYFNVFGLLLII